MTWPTRPFCGGFRTRFDVKDPSLTEFAKLFEAACTSFGCRFFPEAVHYLVETHYAPHGRPLRRCHPRDLLVADQELLHLLRPADGAATRLFGSGRVELFHGRRRVGAVRMSGCQVSETTGTQIRHPTPDT